MDFGCHREYRSRPRPPGGCGRWRVHRPPANPPVWCETRRIAAGWWRCASETPQDIFPERVGHYWVWRDERGHFEWRGGRRCIEERARLLARAACRARRTGRTPAAGARAWSSFRVACARGGGRPRLAQRVIADRKFSAVGSVLERRPEAAISWDS